MKDKEPITQSENWEGVVEFVKQHPDKRIDGFPFSLQFPTMYLGKTYEIITVSGDRYLAKVDDSREFMSEGLEWKTTGNNRDGNKSQSVVAAWKIKNKQINKEATIQNILNWANRSRGHSIDVAKFNAKMKGPNWEKDLKKFAKFCETEIVYL